MPAPANGEMRLVPNLTDNLLHQPIVNAHDNTVTFAATVIMSLDFYQMLIRSGFADFYPLPPKDPDTTAQVLPLVHPARAHHD